MELETVDEFLRCHGFKSVHHVQVSWCGLKRRSPLRTALKLCDWRMVNLLQQLAAMPEVFIRSL